MPFVFLTYPSRHCESHLKFLPQDFIILVDPAMLGHVDLISEALFLGVNPVVDHRSSDICECCEYFVEWLDH